MLHKVLIANRGEVAVRIIKACQKLGIATVAVYSTADRYAWFTELADQAICIGPANAQQSYLNVEAILMAGIITDADAVHPGYGFLAENADFARMVVECGMTWLGPQPAIIELMGDKSRAKQVARERQVPVLAGLTISGQQPDMAKIQSQVGYPLMLKASHGGGGKGMRLIKNATELSQKLASTAAEAAAAFNDVHFYVEHYLEKARHVEVQVLGTSTGLQFLGTRDCSIQQHKQKVIEESPATILSAEVQQRLVKVTQQLLAGLNYQGLGTVEYLFANDQIYFLEMNTRMQVEIGVTELTTGMDLLGAQLLAAQGQKMQPEQAAGEAFALECRLTVQQIHGTGQLTRLVWPTSCRVDTGYRVGDYFPVQYDGLLAKLLVAAPTRTQAIQQMQTGLQQLQISGVTTNLEELQAILASDDFQKNHYSIHWLDQWEAEHESLSTEK